MDRQSSVRKGLYLIMLVEMKDCQDATVTLVNNAAFAFLNNSAVAVAIHASISFFSVGAVAKGNCVAVANVATFAVINPERLQIHEFTGLFITLTSSTTPRMDPIVRRHRI